MTRGRARRPEYRGAVSRRLQLRPESGSRSTRAISSPPARAACDDRRRRHAADRTSPALTRADFSALARHDSTRPWSACGIRASTSSQRTCSPRSVWVSARAARLRSWRAARTRQRLPRRGFCYPSLCASLADASVGSWQLPSFWIELADYRIVRARDDVLARLPRRGVLARRGIMAAHLEPCSRQTRPRSAPFLGDVTRQCLRPPALPHYDRADQARVFERAQCRARRVTRSEGCTSRVTRAPTAGLGAARLRASRARTGSGARRDTRTSRCRRIGTIAVRPARLLGLTTVARLILRLQRGVRRRPGPRCARLAFGAQATPMPGHAHRDGRSRARHRSDLHSAR